MKKTAIIAASLGIVALIGTSALAVGPVRGPGRGYRGAPVNQTPLTQEQMDTLSKARAKFLEDTLKLRQDLSAKRQELMTLTASKGYDAAKAKALCLEMADLRNQLAKKAIEHRYSLPEELRRLGGPGQGMRQGRLGRRGAPGMYGPDQNAPMPYGGQRRMGRRGGGFGMAY